MRRQRALRTSSAQSLCVFCACRLGIEVPVPSTQLPPITQTATPISRPSRRQFSTTRPSPQSTAAATAAAPSDNGSTSEGAMAGFDANSRLSISEQREKRERMVAARRRDMEQNHAYQEALWKETVTNAKEQWEQQKSASSIRTQDKVEGQGMSMADAMKKRKSSARLHAQRKETDTVIRYRNYERKHDGLPPQKAPGHKLGGQSFRKDFVSDSDPRGGHKPGPGLKTSTRNPKENGQPKKVSNPFATKSSSNATGSTSAGSGWGAASTGAAPLAYSNIEIFDAEGKEIERDFFGKPIVEAAEEDAAENDLQSEEESGDYAAQTMHELPDKAPTDRQPPWDEQLSESSYQQRNLPDTYISTSEQPSEHQSDPGPAADDTTSISYTDNTPQSANTGTFGYAEEDYEPEVPVEAQSLGGKSVELPADEEIVQETTTSEPTTSESHEEDIRAETATEPIPEPEQKPHAEAEPQSYDYPRTSPSAGNEAPSESSTQPAAAPSPASLLADALGSPKSEPAVTSQQPTEQPAEETSAASSPPSSDSWDSDEIELLKDLSKSGMSYKEIANMLGHSPASTLLQLRKAYVRPAASSEAQSSEQQVSTPEVETQAQPPRPEPLNRPPPRRRASSENLAIPKGDTQAQPKRAEPKSQRSGKSQPPVEQSSTSEVDTQAEPRRAEPSPQVVSQRQESPSRSTVPEVESQARPQRAEPQRGGWGLGASEQKPQRRSEPLPQRGATTTQDSNQRFSVYGNSGYRAMPFDPNEFKSKVAPFDESTSAEWQHLRKRQPEDSRPNTQPVASTHSSQSQNQYIPPRNQFMDDAWVDQAFLNHTRERDARSQRVQPFQPGESNNPAIQDAGKYRRSLFEDVDPRDKKCARCGQIGHIARHCPQEDRRTCHICGQPGHFASRCPNRNSSQRVSNGFSQRVSNPFEDAPRGAERRTPFEVVSRVFDGREQSRGGWNDNSQADAQEEARQRRMTKFEPAILHTRPGPRQDTPSTRFSRPTEDDAVDEPVVSKEKLARRSRWEDADVEQSGKDRGRFAQRGGRREFDEDADEEADAREEFRARKAARQAKKEEEEKERRLARDRARKAKKAGDTTPISLPEFVSVQQLSQLLGVRYEQFIERLEELGYDDIFPGKTLNAELSTMIAMEYNFEPTFDGGALEAEERDLKPQPEAYDKSMLPERPPVVTIMGHVDHGKTTILDYLRKSSVAAGEAGGITQHIGAFSVPLASSGKTITFLDTPGHAAFLAMRERGANVTDIVILVVAADDSVKPQTLEAMKHAKAAGVPMIVAINKVDKEQADVQRVKQDLARHGVEIEDFGGETQVVEVSGKTGQGMDQLEENVVTLSEVLDHRAETDGAVEGWILEATTKKSGRVATVLVRRGTLKIGNVIVAGKTWARVRSLHNEGGVALEEVGPGMPVEVDGWKDQPMAGDEVLEAPSEQKANDVVEFRLEKDERERTAADTEAINKIRRIAQERHMREKAAAQASKDAQRTARIEGTAAEGPSNDIDAPERNRQQSGQMEVPFIIKADVSGSAEAVSAYIMSVSNPLIAPKILYSEVGNINESDIEMADAAGGHIIAFNLASDPEMQGKAEHLGVSILENNIIYRVLDDVKAVLEDRLPPVISQRVLGEAEVGAAFEINIGGRKTMKIAGCKVRNGVVGKNVRVRVIRAGEKVYDGTISSLKNVKKDVSEMRKGTECGIGFEEWQGFEVGDQIQTYEEISEKRKL